MGLYSRAHLERIIAENGHANCHYCGTETRLPIRSWGRLDRDHATIDHKTPKAHGGTNDPDNLVLACNACNNAKGDRPYDDFVARPYFIPRPPATVINGKFVSGHFPGTQPKKPVEHPAYKARGGTLAAAIESGEVTEECHYSARPASEAALSPEPDYHKTVYCLTGKKVPKRSEIFEDRSAKPKKTTRALSEDDLQAVLAHVYRGREHLLRHSD
jgi:hypothetical protein